MADELAELTEIPLADGIPDPIFAAIFGLLESDAVGIVTAARIDSLVRARGGSRLPYETILTLRREREAEVADARVAIHLSEPLDAAIPYSVLRYNPGSMRASQRLELLEWRLDSAKLHVAETEPLLLEDLRLFALIDGEIEIDIDWWVDKLFGGRLDDTDIVGFVLLRRDEAVLAVAFGYTPGGQGRSGVFDLVADEVVYPVPREYLVLGRDMRARAESLLRAHGVTRAR